MVIESWTSRKMMEELKGRAEVEKGVISPDVWSKISADVYVQEILSYLPASNLQILKTVCKDWLRLITSPYFVRLHLSRANRNRIRVLLTSPCAIVEYNMIHNEETKQIPFQPKFYRNSVTLGSADGLICVLSDEKCFVNEKETATTFTLYNPSTEECLRIQPCPKSPIFDCIICSWFGKRVDGEYNLVMGRLSPGTEGYEFEVYKFTNSNLERIHSISVDLQIAFVTSFRCKDKGILVHGAVHWVVKLCTNNQWRYTIISYHLDENKYSEISPPAQCYFRLGVNVDGCSLLAILKNNNIGVFEVLVMKECWTKYAHIEGLNNSLVLSPLGFFPNGDIILDNDHSQLIKYNFRHNKFKVLMQYGQVTYPAIICVDSLMSPPI